MLFFKKFFCPIVWLKPQYSFTQVYYLQQQKDYIPLNYIEQNTQSFHILPDRLIQDIELKEIKMNQTNLFWLMCHKLQGQIDHSTSI